MPARDTIHDAVVATLQKESWTITDDPFNLPWLDQILYVDLAAEQPGAAGFLAAEQDGRRIAVEVKSSLQGSFAADLEQAVGQYVVYNLTLNRIDPGRVLFLAVSQSAFETAFQTPVGQLILSELPLNLLVIDTTNHEVVRWIEPNATKKS